MEWGKVRRTTASLLPSVLWHYWFGVRKNIRFKKWVLRCWHGYLSGSRWKWFAYGPADATATPTSLASLKSRLVLPFWCWLTQVVRLSVWRFQYSWRQMNVVKNYHTDNWWNVTEWIRLWCVHVCGDRWLGGLCRPWLLYQLIMQGQLTLSHCSWADGNPASQAASVELCFFLWTHALSDWGWQRAELCYSELVQSKVLLLCDYHASVDK